MQVKHLLLIAILALTAACSSNKETVDENLSESQLYQQAQDDLNNKSYNSAVTKLKALESRYPFGRYAEQAQLELIYANYKNMEPEAARAAAERFIRLHPQHPNVDYAYYLKGLSSFDQDRGLVARFLPLDMTKRDPGAARDSFNEFASSPAASPTAATPLTQGAHGLPAQPAGGLRGACRPLLPQAPGLRRRGQPWSLRGGELPGNPAVGDGLAIMVEAYRRLGLDDLASTSLETLKLNYPDNASLKDGEFVARESEADTRSWLAKATLGLIEGGEPPPHMETQAAKDVIKQYEDAEREIPAELKPENQDHGADEEKPESDDDEDSGRSWWSYMTFGLFD
ncbi:competence protein ComL [Pseudomonas aeruginosa]|nr:competence protein ComL [Pseudomonas aeruginosa]